MKRGRCPNGGRFDMCSHTKAGRGVTWWAELWWNLGVLSSFRVQTVSWKSTRWGIDVGPCQWARAASIFLLSNVMLMFLSLYPVVRLLLPFFSGFRLVLTITAKVWEWFGRVFLVFLAPWRTAR